MEGNIPNFVNEEIRSLLIQNINWFMLCLPDNYLEFLGELKEYSIISDSQFQVLVDIVQAGRRSARVGRILQLSYYLRDNRTFPQFFSIFE